MQPQQSYLVCATPRSGSTLFCEILRNTNVAGRPKEYFELLKDTGFPRQPQQYFEMATDTKASILETLSNLPLKINSAWLAQQEDPGYAHYLAHVLAEGTTPNGVFGAKMLSGYIGDYTPFVRQVPAYTELDIHEMLASVFPNLQYIWVTRHDKVRQAVSLWKALQTQFWREDQDSAESIPTREPIFHFAAIQHLKDQLMEHEVAWQHYFAAHDIQPLVVVYEDLVNHLEATIHRTLQYLSIPMAEHPLFTDPTMLRQTDARSEEWVQEYHHLK